MDLSKCDVLIQSGEGDRGRFARYYGLRTRKALRARLTRERCEGDRWAVLWASDQTPDQYGLRTYVMLDDDLQPRDQRQLTEEDIDTDPRSEAVRSLGGAVS